MLVGKLFAFTLGMFAFGFLVLPPLYDVFCDLTGFGGRTNTTAAAATEAPDLSRTVRIEYRPNQLQVGRYDWLGQDYKEGRPD